MSNGFWERRRNRIYAHGGWRIGGGVTIHGHSLFDDLIGHASFFQVLCLEVLGYLPPEPLARWIEASFMCLSFPDPRVWCNQVSALAGTTRAAPTAGITAGVLASDSSLYGPGATYAAFDFLADALRAQRAGETPAQFMARHVTRHGSLRAPGFSRPVATGDDRVEALRRLARSLGFGVGPHEALALELDTAARAHGNHAINMLGYGGAFLLDNGIGPREVRRLYTLSVSAGLHACYVEAADAPAAAFLPLRCDDIEYTGAPPRALPAGGVA